MKPLKWSPGGVRVTIPEYNIWRSMKERCFNNTDSKYNRYGGRGITVCDRWLDFRNFYEDMGPKPSRNHTIDRYPNNDGNYEPSNCRWATAREQANNRRNNKPIEWKGRTMTLAQWSRELNMKHHTLWGRINKLMWPIERAFTQPSKIGNNRYGQNNHTR